MNIKKMAKINAELENLDTIENDMEAATKKIDLVDKRRLVGRIRKLDKDIELLSQMEIKLENFSEKDKIVGLKKKMKTVNKKFDLIEKMLVIERITKLEKGAENLYKLEMKMEKIHVLEKKTEIMCKKIDMAEKGLMLIK